MIERRQECPHPIVVTSHLQCDRSLSGCWKPVRRLEEHRDALLNLQPNQSRGRKDGGVDLPRLDLAQARGNVAAQLDDLEVGSLRHQLRPAAQTRCAHSRSRGKILEILRAGEPIHDEHIAGIFPLERMQEYTDNYIRAGGKKSFSEYYTAKYGGALFDQSLTKNVVFSQHNLVTDRSFSEFNVILCRNVLIYFDKTLQSKVHTLFYDSLAMFGVLVLGSKETLRFMAHEDCYQQIAPPEKIFRKVR
jgi:hypothetical protein